MRQQQIVDENEFIGASAKKIEILLGQPNVKSNEEWTYIIEKYCFGLFKKRLHLYFSEEKVRDYYIGIL